MMTPTGVIVLRRKASWWRMAHFWRCYNYAYEMKRLLLVCWAHWGESYPSVEAIDFAMKVNLLIAHGRSRATPNQLRAYWVAQRLAGPILTS